MSKKQKGTPKRKVDHCLNCYYPLGASARFCPKCGQKRTDGKVPLFTFLKEILQDIFNIDSKILWTPLRLMQPGFLTKAYFEGKHKRYTKPFRLFLFLAVAYFAILVFTYRDSLEVEGMNFMNKELSDNLRKRELHLELDTISVELEGQYPSKVVTAVIDSIHQKLEIEPDTSWQDSVDMFKAIEFQITDEYELTVAKKDLADMRINEILDKYKVEGFKKRLWVRQHIRMAREGQDLLGYWIEQIPWALFLSIPAFALIMKLLYIRRKRYYVEHLVFGYHYHAFVLFLMLILLLANNFYDIISLYGIAALIAAIYLYVAMMIYYKQHWFKTFVKYIILLFWYTISISIVAIIVLIISALLY